jgi:capsular polysaccharide biosynthesis protein
VSLPIYDLHDVEPPQAGFHALDFVPVDDPAELLQPGPPRCWQLIGPARSAAPGPMWLAGPHADIEAEHRSRAVAPGGSVYSVPGHRLGGAGLLIRDRSVFWQADCLPNYFRDELRPGRGLPRDWAHGLYRKDAQIVRCDTPLAVATHANFVYGHFLLEMLPKFWLLSVLRRMGIVFRLALSTRRPPWLDQFVSLYFRPDELVWYDSETQLVEAPAFIVPSTLADLDYHLHPAFNLVADDLAARAIGRTLPAPAGAGNLVYLSRQRLDPWLTLLENAVAVERALAEMGFAIVHPERLSVSDQLGIYRGAVCLVGEYGSALHNALFLPRAAGVICLNRFNSVQHRIAALRGQRLGVVEPVGGFRLRVNDNPSLNRPARIDIGALQRFVAAFLPAPAGPAPSKPALPAPRLPLGDYLSEHAAAGHCEQIVELSPAARIDRVEPLYAEPTDPGVSTLAYTFTDPSFRWYDTAAVLGACFAGGALLATDGLVVAAGKVLRDCTHSIETWRAESIVAAVEGDAVRLKRGLTVSELERRPCFAGYSGTWRNHAHWLTECLPRLLAFTRLSAQVPGLRLLLPQFAAASPQRRSLRLLGIDDADIRWIGPDEGLPCEALWCMGGVDIWRPPRLCQIAASVLSDRVAVNDAERAGSLPTRLYIRRGANTRVMTGYDALGPVLESAGLVTVVMQSLPLDEQIRVMRNARVVVAETSAGLANILFCRPGCRVLELFNPAFVQPAHWTLASLCGLGYGFLVGTHVPTPGMEQPSQNAAYHVAPQHLLSGLRALGV